MFLCWEPERLANKRIEISFIFLFLLLLNGVTLSAEIITPLNELEFNWFTKSYGEIDSISNSSSQGGCGSSIDRSDFWSNEEGSVIKFPEAHPACRGHLLDIVTLLWHTRASLFPEAGSIGLGDLCSELACGSLLSMSCAL